MYGELEQWRMVRAIEVELAEERYARRMRWSAPRATRGVVTPAPRRAPERTRVLSGWLALLLR